MAGLIVDSRSEYSRETGSLKNPSGMFMINPPRNMMALLYMHPRKKSRRFQKKDFIFCKVCSLEEWTFCKYFLNLLQECRASEKDML